MKYLTIIILVIFGIQTSSIAQRGHKGKLEHLKAELELSDDQSQELKTLIDELRLDMSSVNHEEKRLALEEAIQNVLTEEQLEKYEELKEQRGKGRKHERRKKIGKMKKGLAKDTETLERLTAMRLELEETISEEDKVILDELRETFAAKKGNSRISRDEYKDLSEDEKQAIKEKRKVDREEVKLEMEKLKVFVDKYEVEIESLFEENKTFFEEKKAEQKEQWKEDKKLRKENRKERKGNKDNEINQEGQDESLSNRGNKRKGFAKRGKRHMSKSAKFLLMDINMEEESSDVTTDEIMNISVSPNPASMMANITYDIKHRGQVRVEIRDESGRVYDVITNEVLDAGTYTRSIEISKYQDKTYYLSISDGKSIKTEKLIIQK